MMKEYDIIYPGYDFAKNKGYGTKAHIEGIKKQGICDIHRRTFVKEIHNKKTKKVYNNMKKNNREDRGKSRSDCLLVSETARI